MASPPRRRSSRLRTPAKTLQNTTPQLTSLAEDDEGPAYPSLPNLSSPVQAPQTPATSGRIVPPREEMHPSMTHKSTTQKPDSGLRHGFVDINAKGDDQPSGVQQKTPSKIGISSPTFDFRFARPAPVLGPEAQRMMDELREEALRIKAKLAAEREMEQRNNPEGSQTGTRRIAQAKGKVSRYSDVHMAEFKKMDSIANHPSSFRAQPGRVTPTAKALKRTQSKAKLGDRDATLSEDSSQDAESERLENTAPAKRARQRMTDDTSTQRPISRGKAETMAMPSTPRHKISSIPAHLTTPTQSSLARAQSVKQSSTQIPSLSRSPSKPNLQSTPRGMLKSATMNNIAGSMTAPSKSMLRTPSRFDRMKSILKHTSSSFSSKKAEKAPVIPSIARSPSKLNLARDLPSVPTTPIGVSRSKGMKHVGFTPETKKHSEAKHNETIVPQSPSPVKSGIPRSTSKSNMKITSSIAPRKPASQQGPTDGQAKDIETSETKAVEYPSLAGVRPLPEPPRQAPPPHLPPSVPGTFTFRSDHTISFGASPKGFGPSPNQATVRQVRRSIFPDAMPGSFPDGNKENTNPPVRESSKKSTNLSVMPTVPHGMSNKKRRRVESDGEEETRSPKKQKAPEGAMLMAPRLQSGKNVVASSNATPSPAKKRGLTLSRLNMLARPKSRK
ncbi:uncharacterized protein Bfra_005164 [Botrytis fragariae]|uniref:Erythromycin esterase n=1 Tax=Botrytis fragariae TaxID=1964551 RepID=A0A8H6AUF3_9HELO|nr:uncharacterized protein Bfra_005164 [Botrytis fragariae]KAF5873700.1 hypothetical protein Bfra_005164 [Botrytis fragariae]